MPKAIVLYPYEDDSRLAAVILIHNAQDEKRLAESLNEYVTADNQYLDGQAQEPGSIEDWLRERAFEILPADQWVWPFPAPYEVPWTPVQCALCHRTVRGETAHLHQGQLIGEECCWDERLRASE